MGTAYKSLTSEKTQAGIDVLRQRVLADFGTRGLDALVFVRRYPQNASEWQKMTAQEIRVLCHEPFWADAVAAEAECQCCCHFCHE